ncbi:MAG: Rossmann fold domain-containing protein [Pseudomonadota bacterium]
MMEQQAVQRIDDLPACPLAAAAAYFARHHAESVGLLAEESNSSVVLVMPDAGPDHDDWRRALARDLARSFAPKRANVVGASDLAAADEMLAYLRDAPGVTGQYLAAHE